MYAFFIVLPICFILFVCFFNIILNKDIYAFCTSIVRTFIIFDVTVRALQLFELSYIFINPKCLLLLL